MSWCSFGPRDNSSRRSCGSSPSESLEWRPEEQGIPAESTKRALRVEICYVVSKKMTKIGLKVTLVVL